MAEQYYATGRRKASVARVYLKPGSGRININDQDIAKYFRRKTLELIVRQPLELLNQVTAFDVYAHVDGGGWSGQAGAVRLGIARCLNLVDERNKKQLREAGFLTRDSRASSGRNTVAKRRANVSVLEALIARFRRRREEDVSRKGHPLSCLSMGGTRGRKFTRRPLTPAAGRLDHMIEITGIQIKDSHALLALSNGESLPIPHESVKIYGLSSGKVIDHEEYGRLKKSRTAFHATEGPSVSSLRARSVFELERYLLGKGHSKRHVQEASARLVERGYLDDYAYAMGHIGKRRGRRAVGKNRLLASCCAKRSR
jgi:small subunit ribosomal protein S9